MKKRGLFFCAIFILIIIIFIFSYNSKNTSILGVTEEHPFLLNGNWIKAKDLVVGDELTSVNGKKFRIINIEDIIDEVEVYNLEVENYSDFIVNGLIVHNSNPIDPLSSIERWETKPANLELIDSLEGGKREGSKLYRATLDSGEQRLVVVKEVDIEQLQKDAMTLGHQLSAFPSNKLDFYLTTDEMIKELQSQVKKLEQVNPAWAPFYSSVEIINGKPKFIVYSDAYVSSNVRWAGGEWNSLSKISDGQSYGQFIDDLANSNPQVRNKFIEQLTQLKQEVGNGIDRSIAISDGHKDNIMVWIKKNGNKLVDIEVRPIDTFDPLALYPDNTRKAQLEWVDELIGNIEKIN